MSESTTERALTRSSLARYNVWMRSVAVVAALALALGAAGACGSKDERPPPFGRFDAGTGGGGPGGFDSGPGGPPPPDASGFCGNQLIPVVVHRPNLYFVLDRSGSMSELLAGSSFDKYVSAKLAIKALLMAIGHRVSYGAAVYPSDDAEDCGPGLEIFPTQPGDPASYAEQGAVGPKLATLLDRLARHPPQGGTPTAATLTALTPTLQALTGKTSVILATDGAPNCNASASCDLAHCMPNIVGLSLSNGQACDTTFNCCDPANVVGGGYNCVDSAASVAAVAALAEAGIRTYVIGMPGSELFSGVLDELAETGGTARGAEPKYYKTTSTKELGDAIRQIGVEVAISCDIALDEAPPDPSLVNVYFDQTLLPSDAADGWVWAASDRIEIVGPACDRLKQGDVIQVQVVSGCPTEVR